MGGPCSTNFHPKHSRFIYEPVFSHDNVMGTGPIFLSSVKTDVPVG
jgi:hypothetical protein